MTLEQKFHRPAEGLRLGAGQSLEGYASIFGKADAGGDIVEAGAYRASLARLGKAGIRIKMLWQHDPSQPIGVWEEVREDATGLYVKGRLLADVGRGREAVALLEAGAIDGLSIGYRTIRADRDTKGQRHLREIDLWEVSLVTFPMLSEARVTGKAEGGPPEARLGELATVLREAARSLRLR